MSKTKGKPAEPEQAKPPATQPAAGTERAAATPPAPEPPDFAGEAARQAVPDEACGAAVRAFVADWLDDRPAEAAGGQYSVTTRDRWAERSFEAIPDGVVLAYGWAFMFVDGRFVGGGSLDTAGPAFVPHGQFIPMIAHETTA